MSKTLEFLVAHGMIPVADTENKIGSMDSSVQVFSDGKIKIRLIEDRGRQYLDLYCQSAGQWLDVFELYKRIDATYQPRTGSISEAVSLLSASWNELVGQVGLGK